MRVLRPTLGCLALLVAGFGALLMLVGVVVLMVGFIDTPRLERAQICRPGERRDCLEVREGRVLGIDQERRNVSIRVEFDDGRRRETLEVSGHRHPPVRAFVRVELWGGGVAAITDGTGRRYKDNFAWPDRWDSSAFIFFWFGVALIALAIAPYFIPWSRLFARKRL